MASSRVNEDLQVTSDTFTGIVQAFHVGKYEAFYLSTPLYEFSQAFNPSRPVPGANLASETEPILYRSWLTYIERLLAITRLCRCSSNSSALDW